MDTPLVKGALIVFAIIGLITVFAILGMAFHHGGMMGMMQPFGTMMSACQGMMTHQ